MTAVPAYSGRHRAAEPTPSKRRKPDNWSPLRADVRAAIAPTYYATAPTTVMPALEAVR